MNKNVQLIKLSQMLYHTTNASKFSFRIITFGSLFLDLPYLFDLCMVSAISYSAS